LLPLASAADAAEYDFSFSPYPTTLLTLRRVCMKLADAASISPSRSTSVVRDDQLKRYVDASRFSDKRQSARMGREKDEC
jgi:hypothetical protein